MDAWDIRGCATKFIYTLGDVFNEEAEVYKAIIDFVVLG